VSTPLPVAATWFTSTPVDAAITLFTEPHVHPLLRANFWHLRGRDRDLVLDFDPADYRLRPARVTRALGAGHDSSFDGARLHDIIDTYLRVRSTRSHPGRASVRKVRQ
jgi:hypothetical protein